MKEKKVCCSRMGGKTLAVKQEIENSIPEKYTRILLNYYDYAENMQEIGEQISAEFGMKTWLILELNSWYGQENREISDINIKRVKANLFLK